MAREGETVSGPNKSRSETSHSGHCERVKTVWWPFKVQDQRPTVTPYQSVMCPNCLTFWVNYPAG